MLTVVTPAANYKLTTVSNLRAALGLGPSDPSDAALNAQIDQASSAISAYCNRIFARETVREVFEGSYGKSALMLGRFPLVSFESLTVGGSAYDPSAYESEDSFVYRLASNGYRTLWGVGLTVGEYKAGYALPGDADYLTVPASVRLPAILERACTMEIAAMRSTSITRDPALKSQSVEGLGTKTWQVAGANGAADTGGFLNPGIVSMIDVFRIINI